ncbi:hypothetical protein C0Q70_10264 [Pomacea canaliculata]|uniref:Sacsin/Nov domain-containing protein n=1 Tax=Pomacea canaliculata TaxID=400727 RepID=A0A2T7PC49_POMCA|nr:hypothetical protein C0Q70_10264 [Pomacea canaliculata]
MSQETTMWQTLFVACGTRRRQDASFLREVLSEIQAKHLHKSSQRETNRDLKLVIQILETLKDFPPEERRDIILPIAHRERQLLRFRPAVECTVGDIQWLMEAESQCSGEEEVVFVHPKLPVSTAMALGALGLMDRALDETEDIDYAYHQVEPLTTRLHNLLEDSYTDGFSIPKELIQNADDAGARQVKFLLDERQNEDCREHLLHPEHGVPSGACTLGV